MTFAIVGRPNVGKSTLFNRLIGQQHAIVDDQPGVTRDRREGHAKLAGLSFRVIDTAGLEDADRDTLEDRMRLQTEEFGSRPPPSRRSPYERIAASAPASGRPAPCTEPARLFLLLGSPTRGWRNPRGRYSPSLQTPREADLHGLVGLKGSAPLPP